MYGLEKNKKKPFQFDLEVEIHKNPKKAKDIIANAKKCVQNIKTTLRTNAGKKEAEELTIISNGYEALSKVIERISKEGGV